MKTVRSFILSSRFPAVSITGSRCALSCPYCAGKPLAGMINADTPQKLLQIASELARAGSIGFLLSGGCAADGALPIAPYLPAIRTIKDRYRLKINAHVGYPRTKDANGLVRSGIDAFSLSFPVSDDIGLRTMGIQNAIDRYFEAYDSLRQQGARTVVPHVLIGLTDLEEEIRGLKKLQSDPPESIVVIAFFPLPKTPMSAAQPADESHIVEFIRSLKSDLPKTRIVLGCMRKRGNHRMESLLMEKYIDGIVMPSRKAVATVSKSVRTEQFEGCCALYL